MLTGQLLKVFGFDAAAPVAPLRRDGGLAIYSGTVLSVDLDPLRPGFSKIAVAFAGHETCAIQFHRPTVGLALASGDSVEFGIAVS